MGETSPKRARLDAENGPVKKNFTPGMNWKEWKMKKKEEQKKWKELKMMKKQMKLENEKKAALNNSLENNLNSQQIYTISIAVPGSILDNAQSPELKTYLAGQIARAASIFNVNEIIVFNEIGIGNVLDEDDNSLKLNKKNHGCVQMMRILQFLECPQYLRKFYFPIHKDLEYAGLLNPLDTPHHLRIDDVSKYREGIVLNKPVKSGKGSYVYIGLRKSAVIDKILEPNIRVTVKLDEEQNSKKHYKGKAVSPNAPYRWDKIYWGYNVRYAKSFSAVFSESPFKEGYDVTIGTSDKGDNIDDFKMPEFKHLLVVFGGLKGLEACVEADEAMNIDEPSKLFNYYLNTCPNQGSRTIRTEEAVLITLSMLRPRINEPANTN